MHMDMAVHVPDGSSKFATFARQMIPHHANAVAMAKVRARQTTGCARLVVAYFEEASNPTWVLFSNGDTAEVLSKHMEAKDFPAAGTEDQDMDWAKGLVRSIVNVCVSNSNVLTVQYRASVAAK